LHLKAFFRYSFCRPGNKRPACQQLLLAMARFGVMLVTCDRVAVTVSTSSELSTVGVTPAVTTTFSAAWFIPFSPRCERGTDLLILLAAGSSISQQEGVDRALGLNNTRLALLSNKTAVVGKTTKEIFIEIERVRLDVMPTKGKFGPLVCISGTPAQTVFGQG